MMVDEQPRCRLQLKVVPNASRDEVVGWLGEALKIKVATAPEQGKANAAVLRLLASELGLRPSALRIVSGLSTSKKCVEIVGIGEEDLKARFS